MTVTEPAMQAADADLYHQVQQFYARQMQLLDDGKVAEWAATFTADGVFAANAHPQPTVGRDAIAFSAAKAHDQLESLGVKRRHWLGMVAVDSGEAGEITARCYALVFEIPRGGQAMLRLSTLCEDRLVRGAEGWQVKYRSVSRDDLV
jgi:3-phenylpropionate/cinnamic acid dioxygenase small subunit